MPDDKPQRRTRKPTPEQEGYAEWVITSGYVCFSEEVEGISGMLAREANRVLAWVADGIKMDPAMVAASKQARAELDIAEAVLGGKAPRKDWPGEYPLQVWRRRTGMEE